MRFIGSSGRRIAWLVVGAASLVSCRQAPEVPPPATAVAGAASDAAGGTKPHGDHNPHHGGVVMMKGDLHYEVVFDPTGRAYRLYFTDAVRDELPASVASAAALTIKRTGQPDETIALRIDEAGESWIGSGRPVEDPKKAGARVSFTINQEPYWIDLPFASAAPAPAAPR